MTAPRFVPAEATPDAFAGLVRASRHPPGPVPDHVLDPGPTLDDARATLGADGLARVAASAAAVSAWNRLLIAAGVSPDPSYG